MKNNNSLGSSIKSALSVTTLSALLATSSLITSSSAAAFILNFNPGVVTTDSTYGTTTVNSGSYFGLDTNGGGVSPFERTAISQHDGLIVDATTIQQASGSHSFAPDGSESPGIDNAWNYFGNTGMHLTTSPVSVLNADVNNDGGFTQTLDFSGFAVIWNGNPVAPLSGNSGVATLTCSIAGCPGGSSYILDYAAILDGPSNTCFFCLNVPYVLHLEGTVATPPLACGDMNGDGVLNVVDVLLLQRLVLDLP